jgi:hypothetical protein
MKFEQSKHKEMEQVKYADVLRRHRCLFYELFEFIYPRRCVVEDDDEQGQRDTLQEFINTHDARRTSKRGGAFYNGGQHSVTSLGDTIRSTVQKHASQKYSKTGPLETFFAIGHESVKPWYYEELIAAYKEQHPGRHAPNRWDMSLAEERAEKVQQDANDVPATRREEPRVLIPAARSGKTSDQHNPLVDVSWDDQLNVETIPKRRPMEREAMELHRYRSTLIL